MTTAYSSYGTTVDRSSSSYKTKPSTPNRTSSASSSHSSSSSTTPTVLSPPRLTLNGHPIAAPSSAAFPPASPHRKRRSRRDSSGSMSASLKPSRQHDRQQTLPPRRKIKSHTLKHMPNPVLHPHAFLQFVVWRVYLWFQATFVLGMLTDVEVLLLAIVTTLLTCVIAYSLFFHLPNHLQKVFARASYYIIGSEASSSSIHHHSLHDIGTL